jgi:hypothetical protein
MAEVRFQVDDNFLQNLQNKLGATKSTDIAREALTILDWAVRERAAGRDITSSQGGTIKKELAMPSLNRVQAVK